MATTLLALSDFDQRADVSQYINKTRYLDPFILQAQESFFRPMVGETIYNALLANYPSSFTAAQTALYNKAKLMLIYRTVQYYVNWSHVKDTPMGLRTFKEDNSDPIPAETRKALVQHFQNLAEREQSAFAHWLKVNAKDYPDLPECDTYDPRHIGGVSVITAPRKRLPRFREDRNYRTN